MPSIGYGRNYKLIAQRRNEYAKKLRALGIIENSSKWRSLMYRKGV